MNPWTWLEQHPNAALVAVIGGSIALLFFAAWLVHYYVRDVRDWLPRRKNLPGPDEGALARAGEPYADEWDADWQAEPWTDADADQLIADWHGEPLDRTVTRDVWDQWWQGLDGLDRECFLVRRLVETEADAWAELVAETRELCGLAA